MKIDNSNRKMQEGFIRLNKVTREWVIYATARGKRPQNFQQSVKDNLAVESHDPNCPFCPGNEEYVEPIIQEIPNLANNSWQARVITNRYPALTPDNHTQRSLDGIYLTMPGYGQQEVVIESPQHNLTIPTMSIEALRTVIEIYHQRYLALMTERDNMMVIIFRNHGKEAGASLKHPHSQIIATGIVPQSRRWQEQEAQRYFDDWGRCVYCDILAFEIEDRRRVIEENESFVAFVPYAAEVPCEVWIMPKAHQADFGSITASEKDDFAVILQDVLGRLYHKLNNPDYNYVINTAARYKAEEPQLHWYCQIKPRLTTPAGFEIGSGISINPSIPELDAEFLKRTPQ